MVIFGITLGNMLEWYEIYLYVYWAPLLSKLFFNFESATTNLINTFLLFAIGFLTRPLGGIVFGRLGDRIGRKKSLILSVVIMTFPTFVMGLLPTYSQIGIFAPILLGIFRILQSFPAGGELPGAYCFLYESASAENRRYMTSWGAIGVQIGVIISMIECFLLETHLSAEQLASWGWRLSFFLGAIFGLTGFYLRSKLHETPLFREAITHHKITSDSVKKVITTHRKAICLGIFFCILDSISFFLISTLFPESFSKVLGTTHSENLIISIIIMILMTLPLPLYGWIADRYSNKWLLITSTICAMLTLFPIYLAISYSSPILLAISGVLFILLISWSTALIPYLLPALFPTPVRFTCVGLSFNIADGIIGGLTPVIALGLFAFTQNEASYCWFVMICALISLISYFKIDETKEAFKIIKKPL